MVKHTAISYYGLNYVEHAEKDFLEMKEHGCDTVILAITEFDIDFWITNIGAIVDTAHKVGLRCIADPWGIGKYFGGENVSLFLQNNVHHRQVSALTGETLPAACMNSQAFRNYFKNCCLKLAKNADFDGFFWDEPHYAKPTHATSQVNGGNEDWTCRCPECMKKFQDTYGYEMPRMMNDDVKEFRRQEALVVLAETSKALKEYNPKLEITCCVFATMDSYYNQEYRGYDDWDMVASCPYFDVFSTTIIDWKHDDKIFQNITERTVKVAKKYGKESERWVMCYSNRPDDMKKVGEVIEAYAKYGADRLAAWTYRGGYGTVVAAPDALELWDALGEGYKKVLNKEIK